jgi:hypothetical protein
MGHCSLCGHKWGKRDLVRLGFSRDGRNCRGCSCRQYMSTETRRMFSAGYVSILFVFFMPFVVKLSSKDEPW